MFFQYLFRGRIQHANGGGVKCSVEHGFVVAESWDGHVKGTAVRFVNGKLQRQAGGRNGPVPRNSGFNDDVFNQIASVDDFEINGFNLARNDTNVVKGCDDNAVLLADVSEDVGREV